MNMTARWNSDRRECIVFPTSAREVSEIVRLANRYETPLVGRGAGTGLSGGAIARNGGIVMVFSRMNRILEIDAANLRAVVQPGVVNLDLSRAVEHLGLYFAPDPSSQKSCTIGGNVSENSGGPHTLAYGVTANHVTGLELVLPDGEIVRIGGKNIETVWLRPERTVRRLRRDACAGHGNYRAAHAQTRSRKDAAGGLRHARRHHRDRSSISPCGRSRPPRAKCSTDSRCARSRITSTPDFPKDCAAVLLIEVEGLTEAVEAQAAEITEVCRLHHAREVRVARDDRERDLLWKGRKNAFGALGRLSPMYYVQDGVIPRTRLPETLRRIEEVAASTIFKSATFFMPVTATCIR